MIEAHRCFALLPNGAQLTLYRVIRLILGAWVAAKGSTLRHKYQEALSHIPIMATQIKFLKGNPMRGSTGSTG